MLRNVPATGSAACSRRVNSHVAFHHDPTEFSGASSQFDVGLESRLGLQAIVDFGQGFSVTAQELARKREFDSYSLGTEWLYIRARVYGPTIAYPGSAVRRTPDG
jgi:hypothetical protein